MEKRSRRKFSADFKAKVVIEALKERSSLEEIARKYEIHPTQIGNWKKEFLAKAATVFASEEKNGSDKKEQEVLLDKLYTRADRLLFRSTHDNVYFF